MRTLKLLNDPSSCVKDAVEGICMSNPNIARLSHFNNVLVRADIAEAKERQVSLLCGGGSGHEVGMMFYVYKYNYFNKARRMRLMIYHCFVTYYLLPYKYLMIFLPSARTCWLHWRGDVIRRYFGKKVYIYIMNDNNMQPPVT